VILLLFALILSTGNPSPAELADMAAEMYLEGRYEEAAEIWEQLFERMPHRSRLAYNLAASRFVMDSFIAADSVLSTVSGEDTGEDTLSTANALTSLALAIQTDDYGGVENAVDRLRGNLSDGISPECERSGLESGLNWLDNHEPPDDQQDQNEDQQDQNEDQQDQNEDQQDQNEDQQDQNEDQQDQNEDQQDQNEDQQDQNEDQQDQNEDQQDQTEEQEPPPPAVDELTPEQAEAILDLVEESPTDEDPTGKGKAGYPAGPVW